jgi:hypothetical protein
MLILPVSNCVGYDKPTGHHMYHNPKGFEEQGQSGFSQSEDWYIWAVMI